jgi:hypothetical protein
VCVVHFVRPVHLLPRRVEKQRRRYGCGFNQLHGLARERKRVVRAVFTVCRAAIAPQVDTPTHPAFDATAVAHVQRLINVILRPTEVTQRVIEPSTCWHTLEGLQALVPLADHGSCVPEALESGGDHRVVEIGASVLCDARVALVGMSWNPPRQQRRAAGRAIPGSASQPASQATRSTVQQTSIRTHLASRQCICSSMRLQSICACNCVARLVVAQWWWWWSGGGGGYWSGLAVKQLMRGEEWTLHKHSS